MKPEINICPDWSDFNQNGPEAGEKGEGGRGWSRIQSSGEGKGWSRIKQDRER